MPAAFTVGDLALFAAYLWPVTESMRQAGSFITVYKQVGVSWQRMEKMMQGAPAGGPVAHHPVYLWGPYPAIPYLPKAARAPAGESGRQGVDLPLRGMRRRLKMATHAA